MIEQMQQQIEMQLGDEQQATAGDQKSDVQRVEPEIDEARRKRVARMQDEIRADKKFYSDSFKRMRDDMEYARLGAKKDWVDADNYTVPLINRHINQSVAVLYAKNPKAQAKLKRRLMYTLWDGKLESAQAALQALQMGDTSVMPLLMEIHEGRTQQQMLKKFGSTMEILFEYYTGEQTPNFKQQMKQLVRRAKTCGVAYVDLGFQRMFEQDPDITLQIDDVTQKISTIESKLADAADGIITDGDPEMDELQTMLEDLQQQQMLLVREGLIFEFPRSTEIIPHRACKQLRGFIGAEYITREFQITVQSVQELYKIDLKNCYRKYSAPSDTEGTANGTDSKNDVSGASARSDQDLVTVWKVQHKKTRQVYTLVEGYPDYVVQPKEPELKVDGFWTTHVLSFNEVEDEREIFPISDVHYLKHPQREYNRTRQALREHRRANRPKYFVRKGMLEDEEKEHLKTHPANAVIEIKAIDEKLTIEQLIQPYKGVSIDPNLYETNSIVKDILYGVGTQSADMGPTSGATATEAGIAEQGRMSSIESNVDDLDEFLSDIARASGQIMLHEVSFDTVREIVGPGAVWPEFSQEEVAKEIYLDIKAGSSGRPNKAAELANIERAMPFILQLPGLNPTPFGKNYLDLLDIDVEDAIVEGLPSITALNAMMSIQAKQQAALAGPSGTGAPQVGTGDPATDPNQQGGHGGNNAKVPDKTSGGPQAEYPTLREYNERGERVA